MQNYHSIVYQLFLSIFLLLLSYHHPGSNNIQLYRNSLGYIKSNAPSRRDNIMTEITTTFTSTTRLAGPETTPTTTSTETTPTTSSAETTPTTDPTTTTSVSTVAITFVLHSTQHLVPLTTNFVPPPSCINRYYTVSTLGIFESVVSSGLRDPEFVSCQPSGYWSTFSPGMCPDLMTPAGTTQTAESHIELCCQVGFTWDPRGCASLVPGTTRVLVVPETLSFPTDVYTSMSNVVAVHAPITVFWESTDLRLFPADVASSRSALLLAETINKNETTFGGSNVKPGLTLPVRIGIGVGAALGAIILLIAIAVWLWKVRRRRRRRYPDHAQELDGSQWMRKRYLGLKWRAELHQTEQVSELPAAQLPRAEMAENHGVAELPGDHHHGRGNGL